ncbi:MAG: YcxB family protein [Eubacteriales bacterium]|nr:YcxB family protein [Eubacteriales bacterium]MDD3200061.1 YcxB family protein [Eubacteriales bacterium]MDD4122484.1 YcxB family protein [Eubacteriales bacterium]MDD4629327.1 YcxB family protein [Eubacteriales bacterium]
MNERNIKIRSTVGAPDYQALRIYFMYKRKPNRIYLMVIILLISFALLLLTFTSYSTPYFKNLGIIGIIIIAGIYAMSAQDFKKLNPSIKELIDKDQKLNISDRGVSAKWQGYDEAYDYEWSDFEYAVEVNSHFFLFVEEYYAIIISKSSMNEYQATEIRSMIKNHLKLVSRTSGRKTKGC